MTQTSCVPYPQDGESDSWVSLDAQLQATDVSLDVIEQDNISAPSSRMEEDDAKPCNETNLEKSDVDEAQAGHQSPSTSHTHDVPDQSPTKTNSDVEPHQTSVLGNSDPQNPASIKQSDIPRSGVTQSFQSTLDQTSETDNVHGHAPNIVIFGETGVGKSSVINLIAGEKCAYTSNGALGCTFQHEKYIVELDGKKYILWDTTGLDEGTHGTEPANYAEANLRALIEHLTHSGGIHLIMYCIRGARLTKALKRNYDLFYVTVCRKKVPVVLVVTGLEHQQGNMETWWDENEKVLQYHGMWFDEHACVTTLDLDDTVIQGRRLDSQRYLRKLLVDYSERRPWKIEPSLIPWSLSVIHNLRREVSRLGKKTKTIRKVLIYNCTAPHGTQTFQIGARQLEYEVVHVDTSLTLSTSLADLGSGLPGVLVFFASTLHNDDISPDDVPALKAFYDIAGGKTCPMIVVLQGCKDREAVRRCRNAITSQHKDIRACYLVDVAELEAMIERLCIEHVEVKSSWGLQRVYMTVMQFLLGD